MSKEAYLLLGCIRSCGGHWGFNMPVDVLRGSQSRKVMDAQFDKLPLHGLGKTYSSNWWKDLGYQLISYGYLVETVKNLFTTVSVSPKGLQFLSLAKLDQQPPLILPSISAMDDDKECKSVPGRVGIFNSTDSLENESFTKADEQLYYMLLEERMKLARVVGTAPYAICGDQTLKTIALNRPSSKARLANIDGVNQHFLATHGDHLLQTIRDLSKRLNLSLDGDGSIQASMTRKMYPVPNQQKKLSSAKFEAWKMWHGGLSTHQIANFPGRSAPIKEQTVIDYLLDAAQEGCEVDWTRLCDEIGLTCAMFANIQGAVLKVGSRDKLKPIKNELPEDISYVHIKACLAMQDCGVPTDKIPPSHRCSWKVNELPNMAAGLVTSSLSACQTGGAHKVEISVTDKVPCCSVEQNERSASGFFKEGPTTRLPHLCDDDQLSKKRHKISGPDDESSIKREATESSILDLLKNYDGVPLSDILEHFDGSSEANVISLLSCLEGDFLIFQKNNVYKIM